MNSTPRTTTSGRSKGSRTRPPAAGSIAETPGSGRAIDASVRRLLSGLTPSDAEPGAGRPSSPIADLRLGSLRPALGRAEVVQAYLDTEADASADLGRELEKLWQETRGRRRDYLERTSERRAALITRAELWHAASAAPQATEDLLAGLDSYLASRSDRPMSPSG